MSETAPKKRLDPAVIAVVAAGLVLVLALSWLWGGSTPRPTVSPEAERVAALQAEAARLGERLAAVERRPAADPALAGRLQAAEGRIGELAQRPAGLPAGLAERIATAEARIAEEERRGTAAENAATQRVAAVEAALASRIAALETSLGQRIAAIEAREQRVAQTEQRLARALAGAALAGAFEAGRPLGAALAALPAAERPGALAAFAERAPPTIAALRLRFEEAARAGRAAADPGLGQGIAEAATARVAGLITLRRGEQVVLGDPSSGLIDQARRAVEAGDVASAVAALARAPEPVRAAMAAWIADAEAWVAARAAIAALAG
jgi:hypothetical protein